MEGSLKLIRPKLSIGIKALIALTIVFWIPILALITALYFSFNNSLFRESLDTIKTDLKGARLVYAERSNNLKAVLDQMTGQNDIKEMFYTRDRRELQEMLLELGKRNTHAEILISVNKNQKVLSRRNNRNGDIIILGDSLSRSLMTGETILTTELVTREFLALEDESLAHRTRDIGIAQFVIAPVHHGDEITGAIIAGILLTGESWLGNSIHHSFGVEMAMFAGETFESFYLHTTASLPRTTWIIGQAIPPPLMEELSLGKPFYGDLDINGVTYITAFEPLKDSRNRSIGAIGVSKPAKDITTVVAMAIGKVLIFVAAGAFIVAMIITIIIYLDITRPLNLLISAMKGFEQGALDTTVTLQTGDEFEKLGSCFNSMAENVRRREDRLKKHYHVAKLLMSTIDMEELTEKLIHVVMDVTESQLGILYICDEEQTLVPVVKYGCRADLPTLQINEGFPGRALTDNKCIIINLPETDESAVIEMGFMKFEPAEIAYIPLVFKESNMGTLVIGRVKQYTEDEKELFTYLGNQISIALDNTIIHRKIQELSVSDHLTGLYNRRYLSVRLEEEWSRSIRYNEPISVILADLDDFKSVNDMYGHDKGDEVLRNVGSILRNLARKEDVVARYGGEEFVVVFSTMENADAVKKAEEIRDAIKNCKYSWTGEKITVSIGVATYPDTMVESSAELLQRADKAMYEAKTDGKDKVIVCTQSV